MQQPQSFLSEFAPRLRGNLNSLLTPVLPSTNVQPSSRVTKRGTTVVNYSEDLLQEDFEDSDGPRRHGGLRARREQVVDQARDTLADRLSKEVSEPVETQGIWRDWMGKPNFGKTDKQVHAQALLPLTLVPIRIDLNIPSFQPRAALPIPADAGPDAGRQAQFKLGELTPIYKLKDFFLWNLHESLITPKQFAMIFVNELDLPTPLVLAEEISNQIRTQLEEYAGVALHPLFHAVNAGMSGETAIVAAQPSGSRDLSQTPAAPSTPGVNSASGTRASTHRLPVGQDDESISATAVPIPGESYDPNNPDDTYRCIVTLNINLLNKLFTDKFEWSLLHPPGAAEMFAKQTCADMGLPGEWIPAMAHAVYEAVLRLKKDACESGGLVGGSGYGGEIDNSAANGQESGWRYDPEHLADEWEPKVEMLSKEEIEKREGDRERQIRRLRRETARFSSTTNMIAGAPSTYVDTPDSAETPMGRGERSKRKRRFRSLSPVARGATPGGTSESAGYGGGSGLLSDRDRALWRCSYCSMPGAGVWAIRDGPAGPGTLCHNCGLLYERDKRLPQWMKNLHPREPGLAVP